jgi:serine/threonine protein kinase
VAAGGKDHIGRYRLLKLLRSGHNCQVWEAIDAVDNRRFAIKALDEDQSDDREAVAGLKHEHEVAKDFSNPHVIRVYEFSVDRGIAYVVLELFRGLNLKQEMRQSPEVMCYQTPNIIATAADGLSYLHQHGWIHRDIKPDNFLVNHEGETKLIDFAIAQRVKRGLARLLSGRSKIQGTLSYMSPEQIRGGAMDYRSDIYSFGCVLYELVAGRLPYTGTSADELLNKHLRTLVPPLIAANGAITPEFSKLVASMMAKDPGGRPATMEEFLSQYRKLRVFRVRPKPPPGETPSGDSDAQRES